MRWLSVFGLVTLLSSATVSTVFAFIPATIVVDPVAVLSADHTQATLTGTPPCDPFSGAKFGVQLFQPVTAVTPVGQGDTFTSVCTGAPQAWTLVATGAFTVGSARADAFINNNGNTGSSTAVISLIDAPPPLPTSKEQCMNGGWKNYGVFKNQGDCVSFVASKGKNPPAG